MVSQGGSFGPSDAFGVRGQNEELRFLEATRGPIVLGFDSHR